MSVDIEFIALQRALAGQYSLERELGRGGMGIVYLAREVELNRLIAMKVLPSHYAARADLRERFLREARMAAGLSHPHIVPIHRVGEVDGFVFFAMAYVQGETLGERLRTRGPLAPAAAVRMLREVAWALAYAHGRGIVHRDIKPDNILIEGETGRALVSDFGIARQADDAESTDPGKIMGTAQFMSPEQSTGEPLDGRSDLYSLGVVAYLALSGRLPFESATVPALMAKRVSEPAPSLAFAAPSAPGHVIAAIDRCLRIEPAERFANGEELAEALEAAPLARAKLPTALRVWSEQRDPLRGLYVTWSGMIGMSAIGELVRNPTGHWWQSALIAALPSIPWGMFHARKTYRALAAGYSLADLRAALKAWREERREAMAFEIMEKPTLPARILRIVALSSSGTLLYWMFFRRFGPWYDGFGTASVILGATLFITAGVSFAAANAFGVPFIPPQLKRSMIGALRTRFWGSRLGEWVARRLTPKLRGTTAELAFRATEVAIGMAVDDLYAALPKAYRANLGDLPDVVRRLEAHAAAARARLEELQAAEAAAKGGAAAERTPAAVTRIGDDRERARRELADTVAALEAIRLDLLRLHGGAADVAPLTTVLDDARRLGEELDRLRSAQREVGLRGAMPASTPA